jgi:serine/threonine-protein kinase
LNSTNAPTYVVGRYALYGIIAAGGMATVHFGRLLGPVGFSRTVAVKRLHPEYSSDPEFVAMFLDEARLAARIRHPNVIPTLDVVAIKGELFLVMEYVPGESYARLLRAARERRVLVPPDVTVAVMRDALQGLHAAHEAKNERGEPLGIVHRDVSPQNVLVGADGQARVLDFGVAKAIGRVQTTREGQLKGKLSYMAPEQLLGHPLDRQTDIYAAAVVLWEALSGARLFRAQNEAATVAKVLGGATVPPSRALVDKADTQTRQIVERVDAIVMRGLAIDRSKRYATARDMALALEQALQPATSSKVSAWLEEVASDALQQRAGQVADIESSSTSHHIALSTTSAPPPDAAGEAGDPADPISAILAQRPGATEVQAAAPADDSLRISVSSFPDKGLPARKRPGAPILLLGAAAAVLIALGALALPRARPARVESSTSTALAAATTVPSAPPVVAAAPAPPPSDQAPAASLVQPPASSAGSASPSRRAPASESRVSARATKPAVDCNPPFTYDSAGKKHYKPDCI